jgi:hypothetical protein
MDGNSRVYGGNVGMSDLRTTSYATAYLTDVGMGRGWFDGYSNVALSDFIVGDDIDARGDSRVFLSDGQIEDGLRIEGNSRVTLNNVIHSPDHGGPIWISGTSIADFFGTSEGGFGASDFLILDNSMANLYGGSYGHIAVPNDFPYGDNNGILNIYGYDLKWDTNQEGYPTISSVVETMMTH